jgi:hypothetical protein
MWKGICSDLLERVLEEYDLLERKKWLVMRLGSSSTTLKKTAKIYSGKVHDLQH